MPKFKNVELEHHGILHRIAHCHECDWQEEGYMISAEMGKRHTKETGHKVSIEVGTHYTIHPKNKI